MKIEVLEGRCLKYEPVGSRVTCDPAPMDTDQDVLVLSTAELWDASLGAELGLTGFEKGGSDCGNQVDYLSQVPLSFQSFTLGDLNLIITFDPEFYRRFLAATGVAKLLNLMSKDDRVMLFQAVLYGNDPRIHIMEREGYGVFPSFCFEPGKCKGHGSCPQRHSCTE